jgi:hypothetical protein
LNLFEDRRVPWQATQDSGGCLALQRSRGVVQKGSHTRMHAGTPPRSVPVRTFAPMLDRRHCGGSQLLWPLQ